MENGTEHPTGRAVQRTRRRVTDTTTADEAAAEDKATADVFVDRFVSATVVTVVTVVTVATVSAFTPLRATSPPAERVRHWQRTAL